MSLRVGTVLREGLTDLFSERGLLILVAFMVYSLLNSVVVQSLSAGLARLVSTPFTDEAPAQVTTVQQTLGVDLPLALALVLLGVSFVVGEGLRVVAIRAFATDTDNLMRGQLTDDLPATVLTAVVAAVLAFVAVIVGLVLFVVPGLVLAFLFLFVRQEIALNDAGVFDAFNESVRIVTENVVPLLALAVVLFVVGVVALVPLPLLATPFPPLVGTIATTAVSQAVTVYGIAVVTNAYRRVVAARTGAVASSIDETF